MAQSFDHPPEAAVGRKLSCARCGTAFECGLSGECWCAAEPYRLPMTWAWVEDCLCPDCLRQAAAALAASRLNAVEGR